MNYDYVHVQSLKIAAVTICIVVALIAGCRVTTNHQDNANHATVNHQNNSAIVDLVGQGATPEEAQCAIKGSPYQTRCVDKLSVGVK